MSIEEQYLILVENIKYNRRLKNLTQESLAEKADLSSSYIKQIESKRDIKNITLYSLFKIANALDMDITELFKNTKIGV